MGYTGQQKRDYQNAWLAKRRQAWIDSRGGCCEKCGSTDRLEVDHIDPATKVTHNVWSWSEERRKAELDKCQVLCYEHHKEKTFEQLATQKHGTGGMYHRCKCIECRAYQAARMREWRKRQTPRI